MSNMIGSYVSNVHFIFSELKRVFTGYLDATSFIFFSSFFISFTLLLLFLAVLYWVFSEQGQVSLALKVISLLGVSVFSFLAVIYLDHFYKGFIGIYLENKKKDQNVSVYSIIPILLKNSVKIVFYIMARLLIQVAITLLLFFALFILGLPIGLTVDLFPFLIEFIKYLDILFQFFLQVFYITIHTLFSVGFVKMILKNTGVREGINFGFSLIRFWKEIGSIYMIFLILNFLFLLLIISAITMFLSNNEGLDERGLDNLFFILNMNYIFIPSSLKISLIVVIFLISVWFSLHTCLDSVLIFCLYLLATKSEDRSKAESY